MLSNKRYTHIETKRPTDRQTTPHMLRVIKQVFLGAKCWLLSVYHKSSLVPRTLLTGRGSWNNKMVLHRSVKAAIRL